MVYRRSKEETFWTRRLEKDHLRLQGWDNRAQGAVFHPGSRMQARTEIWEAKLGQRLQAQEATNYHCMQRNLTGMKKMI